LIDRQIAKTRNSFRRYCFNERKPGVMIVVDPKKEEIAVEEARQSGIPVIAIASTDCDLSLVDYAIPANDSSMPSITFFLNELATAYAEGKVIKTENTLKA